MLASGKNAKFSTRCKILNSMQNSQLSANLIIFWPHFWACHLGVPFSSVVRSSVNRRLRRSPRGTLTPRNQPHNSSRYRPDAHAVIGHRYAHCHHHGVFGAAGHPRGRTNGCLSALPISPTCPLRQPLLQLRPAVCPPWPANCTKTIQMMKT